MSHFRVLHRTRYAYQFPTAESQNLGRLLPRALPTQEIVSSSVVIQPEPAVYFTHDDFHGNHVFYFSHEAAHIKLEVVVESEVRVLDPAAAGAASDRVIPLGRYGAWLAAITGPEIIFASSMRQRSPFVPALDEARAYALESFRPDRSVFDSALELNSRIHADFKFDSKATDIRTPLCDVFKQRAGVCQDFTHVALACFRAVGLPARYVSGYLETHPPPGCEKLTGTDASHAWVSVLLPGLGGGPGVWVDFDPTNNLMPIDRHITVAWGRDYGDVTPLKGVVLGGGKHTLKLGVSMERISG